MEGRVGVPGLTSACRASPSPGPWRAYDRRVLPRRCDNPFRDHEFHETGSLAARYCCRRTASRIERVAATLPSYRQRPVCYGGLAADLSRFLAGALHRASTPGELPCRDVIADVAASMPAT